MFYLIFDGHERNRMSPVIVDIYTDYSIWYKTHFVIIIKTNNMQNTDYNM